MSQVINVWDGVQNTNSWVHDGEVERSAVDIVELANQVSGYVVTAQQAASNASDSADAAAASVASIGTAATDAIADVQAEGATQIGLVRSEGGTQVGNVSSEGATQVGNVSSEGTTQVGLVQAEGTAQIGNVTSAGSTQIGLVNSAGSAAIGTISSTTSAQVIAITSAGSVQSGLVATAGSTAISDVKADGAMQKNLVEIAGDDAVTAVQYAQTEATNAISVEVNKAASAANTATASASAAVSAQGAAESAKTAAESAQTAAETASSNAQTYAGNASTSASNAASSASAASTSANNAADSATAAQASADSVADSAEQIQTNADNITALQSAVATNTADIATNTAGISALDTKTDITDKNVANIQALLSGNLYSEDTDSTEAYSKTVPSGALPWASLDSIGGKTVAWNQLVDTATTEVSLATSHKYYTFISGTASIVSGTGTTQAVTGGTDIVCDLTLMFGPGNEPSTVAEFEAMFPAEYYPYNAGELMSAGVTDVVSVGRNLLVTQASYNNNVGAIVLDTNTFTPVHPNVQYTFTAESISNATSWRWFIKAYDINGNVISDGHATFSGAGFYYASNSKAYIEAANGTTKTFNVTFDFDGWIFICLVLGDATTSTIVTNTSFVIASNDTAYVPYFKNTYPIPSAVQSLPGYGWSAGTAYNYVYNYVDFERKVFVQNVGSVDLGTLSWSRLYASGHDAYYFRADVGATDIKPGPSSATEMANILCAGYVTVASSIVSATDKTIGRNASTFLYIRDDSYEDASSFTSAMSGVYMYYEKTTSAETDISEYLTDDNLINVEAGGTVTFANQHGDDVRLPVPSTITYDIDLQEAVNNG